MHRPAAASQNIIAREFHDSSFNFEPSEAGMGVEVKSREFTQAQERRPPLGIQENRLSGEWPSFAVPVGALSPDSGQLVTRQKNINCE